MLKKTNPPVEIYETLSQKKNWLVLSDEQMRKNLPFSPLNDEQMSNWLGVEHLPEKDSPYQLVPGFLTQW